MHPVQIPAGRLLLRPWSARDVDALVRAGTDPQVQRWTSLPSPYTRADAEAFAGAHVPQQWAQGGELVWAVCDRAGGEPLASVGLHPADRRGVREVGCWCLPEARESGVVPQAVTAVARWAFAELGVPRLEWAAEVGNTASLRAAVKAGFAYEGRRRASVRRRDGSHVDGWWAARLPSDGPDGAPPALPHPGVLEAGDLRLRPWRSDDGPALAEVYAGEPNSLPPGPEGLSVPEHARWWAAERAPEQWAGGDGAPFVVLAPDGVVAASLQLMLMGRRKGVGEVGVWVTPGWRQRGAATASITAMLAWRYRRSGSPAPSGTPPPTTPRRSRLPPGWASRARAWPAAPSPATPAATTSSWPVPGDAPSRQRPGTRCGDHTAPVAAGLELPRLPGAGGAPQRSHRHEPAAGRCPGRPASPRTALQVR